MLLIVWSLAASSACADDGRVLPDCNGTIAEVTLHYLYEELDRLAPTYQDLMLALPPDVDLRVLCPSDVAVADFVEQWSADASAGGRVVNVINVDRDITLWSRDRYVARYDVTTTHPASLVVSLDRVDYDEDKRNEWAIAHTLAGAGIVPGVIESMLFVEGGNIVSNQSAVFVGINTLKDSVRTDHDEPLLRRGLERELGGKLVMIRDHAGLVPTSHIDMYITPITDELLLVGDVSLAESTLKAAEDDRYDSVWPAERSEEMDALRLRYDSIARGLESSGYRIKRLPLVPDPDDEWLITYNNALIEHRDGRAIVYMPTYDVPALDRAAARLYRGLGFDVRPINVADLYELGGAVRCIANVTRRSNLACGPNLPQITRCSTITLTHLPLKQPRHTAQSRDSCDAGRGRKDCVGRMPRTSHGPSRAPRRQGIASE